MTTLSKEQFKQLVTRDLGRFRNGDSKYRKEIAKRKIHEERIKDEIIIESYFRARRGRKRRGVV